MKNVAGFILLLTVVLGQLSAISVPVTAPDPANPFGFVEYTPVSKNDFYVGTVTEVYVDTTVAAFLLKESTGTSRFFGFPIDGTELARTRLSYILTAKASQSPVSVYGTSSTIGGIVGGTPNYFTALLF